MLSLYTSYFYKQRFFIIYLKNDHYCSYIFLALSQPGLSWVSVSYNFHFVTFTLLLFQWEISVASITMFLSVVLFFQALHDFMEIERLKGIIIFILFSLSIMSYDSLFSGNKEPLIPRKPDASHIDGYKLGWLQSQNTPFANRVVHRETYSASHREYMKLIWSYFTINRP